MFRICSVFNRFRNGASVTELNWNGRGSGDIGMREDPVARRNRGHNPVGLWILGGLALLVVVLVAADLLRPRPAPAPLSEPPAPVTAQERVVLDEKAAVLREQVRARPNV